VDACTEHGVVVFNTPGANANSVKELVLAGLLLASRDVVGGIEFRAHPCRRSRRSGARRSRRSREEALSGRELRAAR
jgi:phosphoglycerate dehydrogenase-like enzyme